MSFNSWLKKHDNLYFALRNKKVIIGSLIFILFLGMAIFGPFFTKFTIEDFAGDPRMSPNAQFIFGTDFFGHDLFVQVLHGLRSTFILGFVGGTLATVIGLIIGFFAGYKGGILDEILMMFTNIMLVIPTIAMLIVIASYLPYRGILIQSMIIGFTAWPWAARAVRSQTLSIKNKEFVNLSRISSVPTMKIIRQDIATNMFSYVFMVFILQFAGSILAAVGMDFIGLGPTKGISLGLIMQQANMWNAVQLGLWWWSIIPGLVLTILVTSLYLINTGLDEVFNPKLREM